MSNPVLNAIKTARDAAATAGILFGAFGLPALMAGGVALPNLMPAEAVEWMGTGVNDPVVMIAADDYEELTRSGKADADAPAPKKGGEPEAAEKSEPSVNKNTLTAKTSRPTAKKASAKDGPVRRAIHKTERRSVSTNRGTVAGSENGMSAAKQLAIQRRNKARGRKCKDPINGINHLFGERYTVERDVLERYDSMEAAVQLARVSWNKGADGKNNGFKLHRVACGSPLTQVGLRNGDVIHKINGKKIRTLPQAFLAIRKVKRHDAIQVEFSRAGTAMSRVVTIL